MAFTRNLMLFLALAGGLAKAQTATISAVTASYPLTLPSLGATAFYSVAIGVTYPIGLTPSSYISGTQLNADFKAFLGAYPNPSDPPEAQLSVVLTQILAKYPQMTGGDLIGLLAGPTLAPGVSVPSGGSIDVYSGTYSTALGIATLNMAKAKPAPVK